MTISIPQDFEKFISEKVQTGRFSSAEAVIVNALSAMREADIIDASDDEQLRKAIQAGIDDLDNGRTAPWDPEKIKADGRKRLQERSHAKG